MRTARERPEEEHIESFWAAIVTSLRNDQFVVFLLSFILYNMGVQMITAALPSMITYARRLGKRWVYAGVMLATAIVFPLLFFIGLIPGPPIAQALVFAALAGLPLAPVQTFPNALIADTTDYDALQTGMRREATYHATQAMFEKVASALALALLALLLFMGSTADNPLGVRLVGPVAGAATLIGYLVFRHYWLPDTVTAETVREAAGR